MPPDDETPLGAELLEREEFDEAEYGDDIELAISLARRGASDALLATVVSEEQVQAVRAQAGVTAEPAEAPEPEDRPEPAGAAS